MRGYAVAPQTIMLGFSLSAKPINEILGSLVFESTHKIFEISPLQTFGDMVRIAAVVAEVRIIVTKRSNQEMAFVRMEDETGSIDVIVFPRIFEKTRNYWIDYKPLLISGRVDTRDESPSLIVEAVEAKEGGLGPKQVFIKVPEATSIDQLKSLKDLFTKNPGEQEVILVFEGRGSQQIKLPPKISWSRSLALRISQLLEQAPGVGVQ